MCCPGTQLMLHGFEKLRKWNCVYPDKISLLKKKNIYMDAAVMKLLQEQHFLKNTWYSEFGAITN